MEATSTKYPTLFKRWERIVNRELKKHNIKVNKKKFKSNVGLALAWTRTIKIPRIVDAESLYIIFHEMAHVIFNHQTDDYMEEVDAVIYSLNYLKKLNIHRDFPDDYEQIKLRGQDYIEQVILNSFRYGVKVDNIPVKVMKFCKLNHNKSRNK